MWNLSMDLQLITSVICTSETYNLYITLDFLTWDAHNNPQNACCLPACLCVCVLHLAETKSTKKVGGALILHVETEHVGSLE